MAGAQRVKDAKRKAMTSPANMTPAPWPSRIATSRRLISRLTSRWVAMMKPSRRWSRPGLDVSGGALSSPPPFVSTAAEDRVLLGLDPAGGEEQQQQRQQKQDQRPAALQRHCTAIRCG